MVNMYRGGGNSRVCVLIYRIMVPEEPGYYTTASPALLDPADVLDDEPEVCSFMLLIFSLFRVEPFSCPLSWRISLRWNSAR